MKNIVTTVLLGLVSLANAQVVIGGATGSAGTNNTSVLLDFATGQNKGIIVPYVRTLPAASATNQGTILLDAATPSANARMKYSNGTTWVDLSGQGADLSAANGVMSTQPLAVDAPELATSRAIIGDVPDPIPANFPQGALVLNSTTKAMVLPIVGLVNQGGIMKVNIPNPSPGMMVYVNTAGKKRLAVYNGTKWSFWKVSDVPTVTTATGRVWMDRNLGASRVAANSTDAASFGDLYQWGRRTDGHQVRTSPTTATLSSTDTPPGNFITDNTAPLDWRSPKNDQLWQGVNGTNNPCPAEFRLPTIAEFNAEKANFASQNAAGAFAYSLKLPVAQLRENAAGSVGNAGSGGYWTSDVSGDASQFVLIDNTSANSTTLNRAYGLSVRCIKN